MIVEQATTGDGPAILRITRAVGVFSDEEVNCVAELWKDYVNHNLGGDYHFIVCRQADQALGYVCFGHKALTEGTWDLYWIAVDPHAGSRGVGRKLLAATEAEVKRRGGYLLLIETSTAPAYAQARQFYEQAGCKLEAVIEDYYSRGDGLALYSKHLG